MILIIIGLVCLINKTKRVAMSVKQIDFIKNMAVFHDFKWAPTVRDEGNNIAEFRKINIFYGRNYAGKTTLSRIFRALETGSISDKYSSPEFQLSFEGGTHITQNSLMGHDQVVRVFNEDFVKENLRFIVDDQENINSFAILGEDNAKIEEEIESLNHELGSEEMRTGLIGKWIEAKETYQRALAAFTGRESELDQKLRDKANHSGSGIKHNKAFGDPNYNVTKIKNDIAAVTDTTYVPITDEKVGQNHRLLKEEPKAELSEFIMFNLQYAIIASKANGLIEKTIQISDPIRELLNDALLETWVRDGREYHKEKRTKCAFCGHDLPADLWEKLDRHFNQESEELRAAIDDALVSIDTELNRMPNLLSIRHTDFYSAFIPELEAVEEQFLISSAAYCKTLESIKVQLETRKNDIFRPYSFEEPVSEEQNLNSIRDWYQDVRVRSNEFTKQLSTSQSAARNELRLHEIFTFITDIKYSDELTAIGALLTAKDKAFEAQSSVKEAVDVKQNRIHDLKAQLKDESKGADRVNDYLNNFFGHQSLSLQAIEKTPGDASSGYRFEVTRDGEKAYHLSEGEVSLIAFCYFMAKLEDIETKGNQPIIWIDDPISSLDTNHIFFIYSLINAEIVTPEKFVENGEVKERERFKQLFISTHNLDFLKYLKRLPGAGNKRMSQYFIINRADKFSSISLMPRYLKDYVTEFNYLFQQIHACASIETIDDTNYTTFYNFGNNARKFFEIYLYYKYPDRGMSEETLMLFFGEEKIPAILTDRINNEYSHLSGVFERGSTPTEVPEMQTSARQILEKLKEDRDQYSALLKSIGIEETL